MSKSHLIPSLVASRICHDLISPVGAIGNGVELLEAMTARTPELALISDSVDNAKAKLQFFRVCFGHASAGALISRNEVEKTARGILHSGRINLTLAIGKDSYERGTIRMVFLMLLCVESALPLGGDITVSDKAEGWRIDVEAPRLNRLDVWEMLQAGSPVWEVTPAQVQFPMLAELITAEGKMLSVNFNDTHLTLILSV